MGKKQTSLTIAGVLALIVGVVLIGIVSWNTWQNLNSNDNSGSSNTSAEVSPAINEQAPNNPIVLTEANLPAGWAKDTDNHPEQYLIQNESTKCWVETIYTTDAVESNPRNLDQNKITIDAIKAKGYAVEDSKSNLTIVTNNSQKQIDAQLLKITGWDNPLTQKHAYIVTKGSLSRVTLSCPAEADLPSAQEALMALRFSHI